jgi:hypothetical protein
VMTTNTTLLAINAAEILLGWIERRKAGPSGSSKEFAALLPLGLGFLGGTVLGAIAYIRIGLVDEHISSDRKIEAVKISKVLSGILMKFYVGITRGARSVAGQVKRFSAPVNADDTAFWTRPWRR